MITCSRCGKENQDLYKFCLGCGAKLQAAAPAPKPAPPAEMLPPTPPPEFAPAMGVAKTAVPPEPAIFSAVGPTGEKIPGSGGTAVLATPMAGANSGGGVGGSISAGGAGFGAGAAACNLAPQPRQNL